jgi:hypothetical protein
MFQTTLIHSNHSNPPNPDQSPNKLQKEYLDIMNY